jgi:hypothetical protein
MITMAVLCVGDRPHAKYCVKSFKDNMPDAEMVQVTDMDSPEIEGVDRVVRHNSNDGMMMKIIKGFAELEYDDILITTADDCILDKPLVKELDGEFDVAIVHRKNFRYKDGQKIKPFIHKFPYTNGLVIVKNKKL